MKPIYKRLLSGVLSAVMTLSAVPIVSPKAEESTEPYPYTMFAASSEDGAITVNAGNFCVNGNIATNGTIVSSGNTNINGTKTEDADESMIFIFDKIDTQYFSVPNVEEHEEDYALDELNININVPTEVQGEATLTGNNGENINYECVSGKRGLANFTKVESTNYHYVVNPNYNYHTEQDIIEYLYTKYKETPNVEGHVTLISQRPFCPNCNQIVSMFEEEFPNIFVERVYVNAGY